MDAAPARSTAPPIIKSILVHEHDDLSLAGTKGQGAREGSPPKRAKTGQNEGMNAQHPARGRLPVLDERDRAQPAAPRITLRVKPVSLSVQLSLYSETD